ncbi:hypothetical protein Cylst_5541 [Cylindrospermum stagnale PCC 7417]|uniref:Uncharacterized protein n=1 Tax=Cylindrospermum stagnale PCC 7417 TaxID=56107 RepID=K9X4G8_9NOST|nr:hypothetical protein [Cylindrospermum stagnale]AFZ27550.1 hypothetical protein Cylst_5541 [Cylindrospermum stagnale PCC 7417]
MKIWKSLLIVSMILVNFAFAQPSLAERPKFTSNPDYIEVTQALNELKQSTAAQLETEGSIPPETQKKIDELAFQQYALESGTYWGQCRNETGKTLAVYGKRSKNEDNKNNVYDNGLYFLADGQTTKRKWDCDGFYLPNDAKIIGLSPDGQAQEFLGPVAVKIADGSQLVIKTNPETAVIEINVPNAQVVKTDAVNWFIPNVSQALIDTRLPNAPSKKS